ncbi:MAG: hypothetical protein AAF985_09610, partial [Bacteroidota bacterium]
MNTLTRPLFLLLLLSCNLFACQNTTQDGPAKTKAEKPIATDEAPAFQQVQKIKQLPTIDGLGGDDSWQNLDWQPIDQVWLGAAPTKEDFSGRENLGVGNFAICRLSRIFPSEVNIFVPLSSFTVLGLFPNAEVNFGGIPAFLSRTLVPDGRI